MTHNLLVFRELTFSKPFFHVFLLLFPYSTWSCKLLEMYFSVLETGYMIANAEKTSVFLKQCEMTQGRFKNSVRI